MKKIYALSMAVLMAFSLMSCSSETSSTNTDETSSTNADTTVSAPVVSDSTDATAGEVAGLTEPIAEQPALITSAGQSADASMLSAILDKADFHCDTETSLEADNFDTSAYKTLIFGVGGSQKGLGAAGVDAKQEQSRVDALVEKAKDAGLTIIVAHIGGDARRGELSDGFISAVSPEADYLLVVEGGDDDGLFTSIAQKGSIPMDIIDNLAAVGPAVMDAFKS